MKLFERITLIAANLAGSQTGLAKAIGVPQGTFNGYLSDEGQRKIRIELLESIQRAFPQVNRNWLYFGEGDMLDSGQVSTPATQVAPDEKDRRIAELEEELREERRLNRRLMERLLDEEKS